MDPENGRSIHVLSLPSSAVFFSFLGFRDASGSSRASGV